MESFRKCFEGRHEPALFIDDRAVPAREGESVLAVAQAAGIYLPALCGDPLLLDAGDCGLCLVEVEGIDGPVRACQIRVAEGLEVRTDTPAVLRARRAMLKVILTALPRACLTCARREGCSRSRSSTSVPVAERCRELPGSCELERVADFIGLPADTPRPVFLPPWSPGSCGGREYTPAADGASGCAPSGTALLP